MKSETASPRRRRRLLNIVGIGALVGACAGPLSGAGVIPLKADPVPDGVTWTQTYFPSLDGTMLHADVYAPTGLDLNSGAAKLPVVVQVGPYFGTGYNPQLNSCDPPSCGPGPNVEDYGLMTAGGLVAKGYVYVAVDLRGYGASGGCSDLAGKGEADDTEAAIHWAATQPWSTGKVGVWGGSYSGETGMMALARHPAGLAAVVTMSPFPHTYRGVYMNRDLYVAQPLVPEAYSTGELPPGSTPPDGPSPTQITNHYSFAQSPAKCWTPTYTGFLGDNPQSAFWLERDYAAAINGTDIPVLWCHGFHDTHVGPDNFLDVWSTLRGPHRAWFGDFGHYPCSLDDDAATAAKEFPTSYLGRHGFLADALAWFDVYLKGRDIGTTVLASEPRVVVQSGSDGSWRGEKSWPPAKEQTMTMKVMPGSYRDGTWENQSEGTNYAVHTLGSPPIDISSVWPAVPDSAVPHGVGAWSISEPFPSPEHLAGVAHVDATIAKAAPKVNVDASVYDIDAGGRATLITRGVTKSGDGASAVTTETVGFDLYPQDWTVPAGHRLGVLLSGSDLSWSFGPGLSQTPVTVMSGALSLPIAVCRSGPAIDGGPSDVVVGRAPISLSESTLAAAPAPISYPGGCR